MTVPVSLAAFEVHGLRKSYGSVPVLRGIELRVGQGEVHALLGANGAGKSTLIKCIAGSEKPDAGTLVLGGHTYSSLTPRQAREAGVAVVHQQPLLAMSLTVAENIFLGDELRRGPILLHRKQIRAADDVLSQLGASFHAESSVQDLGNGELALVEIAKALIRQPRVLVLDEPTAALTEREVERLAEQIQGLRACGIPILFVTHRLTEALTIADHVTVLRGGTCSLTGSTAGMTRNDLVQAIVDESRIERSSTRPSLRPASDADESASDVAAIPDQETVFKSLCLRGPKFGPLSLSVHRGEILGLFGLVGAGRTEYLETIAGARKSVSGTLVWKGHPLRLRGPSDAVTAGIALVPSDRLRKSIFFGLSGAENVILPRMSKLGLNSVIRSRRRESQVFDTIAKTLDLRPRDPNRLARGFSGGNQQKLVIGRWLNGSGNCDLLLLDEPTDGVDVGARSDLYTTIKEFVANGGAVVMASSEPEELISLADRVVVLARGHVAGVLSGDELNERSLLQLAHSGE